MGIRLTVLSENTARASRVLAEFGWSVRKDIEVIALMVQEFGDRFFFCNAGTTHDLI